MPLIISKLSRVAAGVTITIQEMGAAVAAALMVRPSIKL
jgi:antitoxin (DNA-binding transcriptional repressor) of toxin-antitoxin stability system